MANLPGDSIQIAREYMDSLLVESRIIGAVRPVIRSEFVPEKVHHRMTREFSDFAKMIDGKDRALADRFAEETLGVMKIVG